MSDDDSISSSGGISSDGTSSGGTSSDGTSSDGIASTDIVVGVDGSPEAAAALVWAAGYARTTGSALRMVHTWLLPSREVAGVTAAYLEARASDANARATQWVLSALAPDRGTRWTLHIVEGAPGPVLVERSRHASLLVLGTGAHTGLRRLVAGSVSHYVLSHAVPPVVAVRATPATSMPVANGAMSQQV